MSRKALIITTTLLFLLIALAPASGTASAEPSDLFFSEYIEGSSYNKALEIYNGTGAAVDLSAYTLELYSNGASTPNGSSVLSGTLADGDVYVMANTGADPAILAVADVTDNSVINFNGDDTLVLRKGGDVIDAFGQVGFDPGYYWGVSPNTTQNHTLRRKEAICEGDAVENDPFDPALEWDFYAEDTFDGLGAHTASCGVLDYTPIYDIQYTEDPSGDSPLDGDTVITEGVVTGVFSSGIYIQDPAGGPWTGLWVYFPSSGLSLGDRVRLTGVIDEYYNLTEMLTPIEAIVLSSGNPLPAPALLATGDVSQEQWEGVLVQVEDVTVTDDDLGYGEWEIDDGSGSLVVDNGSYTYTPVLGDTILSVTGPLNYTYSAFKILPRDDNDIVLPLDYTSIYEIQYSEDDPADSPYKDQEVRTEGIVTMIVYNGFYIEDPAGGPWSGLWVYAPPTGLALGDRVSVTGTIIEYYNLTELTDLTDMAILSSGNPLPAPEVLATGDVSQEQWEGVLVQVQDVTVTNGDMGYGEWAVDDGSGEVVLDDKGSYTYEPTTGDFLASVTGPLDYSYSVFKILPRDDNDIVLPLDYIPIYDIQYTTDPYGASPYAGQVVTTEGIVTAVFYNGYFIQDPAGGPWSGLWVYDYDLDPEVGDWVRLTGEITEYYGLTELLDLTEFEIISSGNPIPAPEVLPTGDVSQEQWEGVLVQVQNVTVTDDDLGYGEWQVDDDSGPVVVDDKGSYLYEPVDGDALASVTGPLDYGYGAFKIQPRTDADILLNAYITYGACGDAAAPIHIVQGDGYASPLDGMDGIVLEAVVVGDFQESDQLRGFYLQEEDADADDDPDTSEGIFVFEYNPTLDVNVGDVVRLQGEIDEYYGLTEFKYLDQIEICGTGALPTPAEPILPVEDWSDFEAFEGMRVTFPQTLTISEYYNFDYLGQIVLTLGRQYQPTAVFEPGSDEAIALAEANALGRIILDDGRSATNPDPALHPNGFEFTLENLFRGGGELEDLTGVVDYNYGEYKVHATQGATYIDANPRPEVLDDVGSDLTVASFNVLNYFTTIDTGEEICGPSQDMGCRGADTEEEFLRQRAKIISATLTMDADVVGLIEIENHVDDAAVQDLVQGLNDLAGPGTYEAVWTGPIGTDAIKQAFIYKPAAVSLVGDYAVLDDEAFTNPLGYDTPKSRPALAQTFMDNQTGGIFTAVINHLKSKGSTCGEGDDDPVQGSCNLTRTLGAEVLAEWLAGDPTGSGDADFLILGDLNAYDKEDPIDALLAANYHDLLYEILGEYAYSYVYDGQLGYLDHALANPDLRDEVTGVTVWHINTDEPDLIDYDMTYKKDAQDAIYYPDPYRSSDHDPVVVGLGVCDEIAPTAEVTLSKDVIWPPNHKMVKIKVWVDASDNFDNNPTIELVSVTSNEPDDGLGDGDMPNDIDIRSKFNIWLRAERSGLGDGRIYTITYRITDDCGNSSLVSAEVVVPHSAPSKD